VDGPDPDSDGTGRGPSAPGGGVPLPSRPAFPEQPPSVLTPPVPPGPPAPSAPLGAAAPGADPAGPPEPAAGRRTRRLAVGAAALTVLVVLAVLIPILIQGSGQDGGSPGPAAASPSAGVAATTSPASAVSAGAPGPLTVLAHQGGSETYALQTLPAFVAAATSGAAVETDVHWTSDGVAVLVHDDETTPADEADAEHPLVCRGGPYAVSRTTWSVLRQRCRTVASTSEDGRRYPIPTFDEAMRAIAGVPGAQIFAEVKAQNQTPEQTSRYLATITKYGMAGRTIVSSFFPDTLARVRAQGEKDQLPLRYLLMLRPSPDRDLPRPEELGGQRLWGVALRADIATQGNVAALRAQKLTVIEWTVDTVQQWSAARKAEVDAVLTNRPDAYRSWAG
jgi:glycerophosphoryl diester phosphodiesterase